MRRKTKGWLAAGIMALTVVSCTWAYYSSTSHIENQLKTKTYGSTVSEEFTPRDDWQPGQRLDKKFGVKNTGDYPLVVRVRMAETWRRGSTEIKSISSTADKDKITVTKQDNATDGLIAKDDTVVAKQLDNTQWVFGDDGYWYFMAQLASEEQTGELLSHITLIPDADMGKYSSTSYYHEGSTAPTFEPGAPGDTGEAATGWKAFVGPVPAPYVSGHKVFTRTVSKPVADAMGYAGAEYTLIITAETCQATKEAVQDAWGLTMMPAGVSWGF